MGDVNIGLSSSTTTAFNPYKFRVSLNGAANVGSGAFAVIAFDTKQFDSNSNVSAGVYTAPVAGFYFFSAHLETAAAYTTFLASLFKNGSEASRGPDMRAGTTAGGGTVSDLIQLAAGDTVDVRGFGNTGYALDVGNTFGNYFSGFLVSRA